MELFKKRGWNWKVRSLKSDFWGSKNNKTTKESMVFDQVRKIDFKLDHISTMCAHTCVCSAYFWGGIWYPVPSYKPCAKTTFRVKASGVSRLPLLVLHEKHNILFHFHFLL